MNTILEMGWKWKVSFIANILICEQQVLNAYNKHKVTQWNICENQDGQSSC